MNEVGEEGFLELERCWTGDSRALLLGLSTVPCRRSLTMGREIEIL